MLEGFKKLGETQVLKNIKCLKKTEINAEEQHCVLTIKYVEREYFC